MVSYRRSQLMTTIITHACPLQYMGELRSPPLLHLLNDYVMRNWDRNHLWYLAKHLTLPWIWRQTRQSAQDWYSKQKGVKGYHLRVCSRWNIYMAKPTRLLCTYSLHGFNIFKLSITQTIYTPRSSEEIQYQKSKGRLVWAWRRQNLPKNNLLIDTAGMAWSPEIPSERRYLAWDRLYREGVCARAKSTCLAA